MLLKGPKKNYNKSHKHHSASLDFFWLIGRQKKNLMWEIMKDSFYLNTYLQAHLSQFIICIFDQDEAKQAVHKQ